MSTSNSTPLTAEERAQRRAERRRRRNGAAAQQSRFALSQIVIAALAVLLVIGAGGFFLWDRVAAPEGGGELVPAQTAVDFGQVPIDGGIVYEEIPLDVRGDLTVTMIGST